ncbi:MAG: ABC transporter substrate-binding protein [Cyanobacteria bacterium J06631_9]
MNILQIRLVQLLTVSLTVTLFACAPPSNEQTASQVDTTADSQAADSQANQSQTSVEQAEKVVALTSLTADLVATLDESKLVGIPGSRLIREDPRFTDLPAVSEGRTEPDLEKIVALNPDLVIGAGGFHDKTLARLQELGTPVLTANVDGWEELRELTTTLASSLSADPQPLLDRYDACLSSSSSETPSTLTLVSRQPLLAPNKNSWAGDFLTQLNVNNIAADFQGDSPLDGYITLSAEKVLEANPDRLIVVNTGEDLLSQLQEEPFWNELKAVRNGAVETFDYFGLVNPGSLASIEKACEQLKSISTTG